ncbi:hypothetical protein EW146_g697 [Bondarzewia mesenterica]|uniref:ATP-dependent RNA helicase n=1 Tax=Bondarzewia mesenterica TaxID=1095465 RepID=A0A4S4M681_9AGAM|nr:hypothetical protein EW146_g697 [Bondarzewia mesenterica]
MSTSPAAGASDSPHIVSLVLQSKKALQHGQALCSRANSLSNSSAQDALNVLALNAKVKWLSDAVLEQLKLAASVAKSIEEKRSKLEKQTQAWDTLRTERTNALDAILESLGRQLVPPDFHENSSDSSIFGIQSTDSDSELHAISDDLGYPGQSPTLTIRHGNGHNRHKSKNDKSRRNDRSRWKSLRDFIDERAIEDTLETVESDRAMLDDVFVTTADYPITLHDTVTAIRKALPTVQAVNIEDVLISQENISTAMAGQLESLAVHYDQMEGALRESEAGEVFGDEDLQEMNRDTDELPAIISELEASCASVERIREELLTAKHLVQQDLETHRTILDDLEELGDIMGEMLHRQQEVEIDCSERLASLHDHLFRIEELSHQYTSYQLSFNKLVVEMARRRQYKEAAENIVRGMVAQIEALTEEEQQVREDFNTEHGAHLPSDICLYIENPPTRWEVVPLDGETTEVLPDVEDDLLMQARDAIARPAHLEFISARDRASCLSRNWTLSPTMLEKTKAKKRYLKAKKERKKKRKSVVSTPARKEDVVDERSSEEPEDAVERGDVPEDGMEVDEAEDATEGKMAGEVRTRMKGVKERKEHDKKEKEHKKEKEKKEKKSRKSTQDDDGEQTNRPRKRRKIHSPGPSSSSSSTENEYKTAPPSPIPPASSPPATHSLPSSLPSFPIPARPNAPARSELAAQGLDRAFARAQLVDPALSIKLTFQGEEDEQTGLSLRTRTRLRELGIEELFAVQTMLLPLLLPPSRLQRSLYLPYNPPSDICVSAPTGSGKTLAYVLPIVEVRETFEASSVEKLSTAGQIGTATGQHSFAHEQNQLISDRSQHLQGGSSKVDILICTPGRLMDHLNGTPIFSLQHLRFLVIDEADRLLAQSFQDWLAQVLAATRPPLSVSYSENASPLSSSLPYPDALSPAFLHLLRDVPTVHTDIDEKKETSCQKLLFSATLMSDPGKIAALELRDPRYIVVQSRGAASNEGVLGVVMEQFRTHDRLRFVSKAADAVPPLHAHGVRNALVFTKSAESTLRLVRLFEFFENARRPASSSNVEDKIEAKPIVIRAYSSDLTPSERKSILEKFKAQEIDMLVCSDLISRGIDISHVAHVVSYDVPVDMRKYVHRVGRTARAGREGDAWTLVEEQEARYFKEMLRVAEHVDSVGRVRVSEKQLAALVPYYETALQQLKEVYARDRRGEP